MEEALFGRWRTTCAVKGYSFANPKNFRIVFSTIELLSFLSNGSYFKMKIFPSKLEKVSESSFSRELHGKSINQTTKFGPTAFIGEKSHEGSATMMQERFMLGQKQ